MKMQEPDQIVLSSINVLTLLVKFVCCPHTVYDNTNAHSHTELE